MVMPVSQFFTTLPNQPSVQRRPLFTSIPYSSGTHPSTYGPRNFHYSRYWRDFRRNPELMSPITIMITDIMGDKPIFVAPDGKKLGRNKMLEADKFWQLNRGKETVSGCLYDMFTTGDGYIWKGSPTKDQVNDISKEIIDRYAAVRKLSSKERDNLYIKTIQDEDLKKPKIFDYIASSTVSIESTPQEIIGYIQRSNGLEINFNPKEVIHFRFMTIDGKVEGFSPVEALFAEIALLWLVKGNMIAVMENGGAPDQVYILPKEIAGSKNHDLLVDTLTKYKSVRQRHGGMVFTGEVNIEKVGSDVKDLEYQELALYITSNIAYSFQIPVTRIPYLIGKAASGGDSGGLAEKGYWTRISEIQDMIENLLNNQMFDKLGWAIRFNRSYKQDEVREAQVFNMNIDSVQKAESMLHAHKKRFKVEKIVEILDVSPNDLEEIPEDELLTPLEKSGMMGQNMLNNNNINKEPDNRKRADTKKNVANQKGVESAGA